MAFPSRTYELRTISRKTPITASCASARPVHLLSRATTRADHRDRSLPYPSPEKGNTTALLDHVHGDGCAHRGRRRPHAASPGDASLARRERIDDHGHERDHE